MKKKNKLDSIYNEISANYKKDGVIDSKKIEQDIESLNREIEAAEKEIEGKKSKLDTITNEDGRKKVEDSVKEAEHRKKAAELRKQNLEGYMKYGDQIEKIQTIKATWVQKVSKMEQEHENGKQKLKDLDKQLQDAKQKQNDKLKIKNSEKITNNLTNNQYNSLMNELTEIENNIQILQKNIEEQKVKNQNMAKKITELKFKIGKSDLAWKTLFTNKDWDEIQKRSIGTDRKFTRKTEENQEKAKSEVEEEKDVVEPQEEKVVAQPQEEKALISVKSGSLIKKLTDYFKNSWNKIFKKNGKKQAVSEETKTSQTIEEETKTSQAIEEEKENQNRGTTEIERDSFLERLRFHVDSKYKENTTMKKEQDYIKAHEVKDKEEER